MTDRSLQGRFVAADGAAPQAVAPYGSWPSPVALELVAAGFVRLAEPRWDGAAATWLEGRAEDAGRQTLVRWTREGGVRDVSPAGINVRTRVHEYGGAAYLAAGDLVVVSDFSTGRLLRVGPGRTATPLTPEGRWRYADPCLDAARDRLVCVREDHAVEGREAVNTLVAVPLDGSAADDPARIVELASGSDFVAAPRLSPDGRRLAWIRWNHPNMPWNGTECVVAPVLADGSLGASAVAAGDAVTWVTQPAWSPDGALHVSAELDGWLNLHRVEAGRSAGAAVQLVPVAPMAAEIGGPEWNFGYADYGFDDDGTIIAAGRAGGRDRLYRIGRRGATAPLEVPLPFTELDYLDIRGGRLVCLAAAPDAFRSVVLVDLADGSFEVLRRASDAVLDPADLATAEPIEFPTTGGRTAHGILYRPHSRAVRAPDGELPPLVVTSHGGPTSAAYTGLAISVQVLATRGIAVLDVDYGGSSGYGREYRKRLDGQWGIVDVDDCVAGARTLAARGIVDPARIAIEGGSASGFTALAALAFRDIFAGGVSYFGIGNLAAFAAETHKFESRYLEGLVGPYPAARDIYEARSPAFHADGIRRPVLVLQGLDDRVVPPAEAERIVAALRANGVRHAYVPFEGEDHGFRKASSILRSAQAELAFYGAVFGFVPADALPPLVLVGESTDRSRPTT
ncbi:MAG TPA: prolyl oligopeptidase family serine peptidase [Candidatus Limnocylindrales bacterium]